MADNVISYKIQADGTSIRDVAREADNLKAALRDATDPKEINRLNKELDATNEQLKSINKAAEQFNLGATFEDIYGDVQPLTGRLGELEDRMYELALAGKANSDEFKALQNEAATMRKTIIDVDKQVDLLAENQGMSVFAAGFGEVADSFMRLDFESASAQASNLAKASSQISFGSAVKSLKNLGKTFISLGKALLTNPLFLIVGVVSAIIAVIVKLMDEMGILQDIFNAVGDAIGWVIQQFKDLLDWIGLTNYAAEDAAERQAEAAKKRADEQEKSTNKIVAALDHEIRMMKADGEVTDEEFLRIIEAEKEKRKSLLNTAKMRELEAQAALDAAILKGDLDDEEIQDLKDKLDEAKAATLAAEREIVAYNDEAQTQIDERNEKSADKEQQNIKDQQKTFEEYQQKRLDAQRTIQDLTLELMSEGTEKEIAETKTKYDRLIEDTKSNEELNESEKTRIVEQYEKLRQQKINDINEKSKEEEKQKELDFQNTLQKMKLDNMKEGAEKQKAQIQSNFENEKAQILNNETLKEEEKTQLLKQLKIKRNQELKAIDDETEAEQKAIEDQTEQLRIENMQEGLDKELALIENKYAKELEAAEGNAELIKQIEIAKQKEVDKIRQDAIDEEIRNQKAAQDFALQQTSALFSQLGSMAEEGSAASKVLALASIIADTASALMKAVPVALEASKATGPAAPFVFAGTLAGIAGTIVGAAANAKSVLQSAPGPSAGGGGGGGGIGPPPSPNIGTPQPDNTPDVIFGNENDGVEQTASSTNEEKVYVVDYTDIQNTGNEVNKLQQRVQLN